jgi:hypothetical protein
VEFSDIKALNKGYCDLLRSAYALSYAGGRNALFLLSFRETASRRLFWKNYHQKLAVVHH